MTTLLITHPKQYLGYALDAKPADAPVGSTFDELDTGVHYTWDGALWLADATPTLFKATKTLTFDGNADTGAVGEVPLFVTTGQIEVVRLVPFVTLGLDDIAPNGATLSLGVDGLLTSFIVATDIDDLAAPDEYWFSIAGGTIGGPIPVALKNIAITTDIRGAVAVADIDTGEIRFDVFYRPISAGATLVATP